MPLRHRILANPETVQDLELAGEERYWDGITLMAAGHRAAGIYLLGYTAEMILKNACFLFEGAKPHDLIAPRLGPVRSWAKRHVPGPRHESYHSLVFWSKVLREKRRLAGRQLDPLLASRLAQRVRRLFGIWIVDMRYQPDRSLEREAESVYADVTWVRDQRVELAR